MCELNNYFHFRQNHSLCIPSGWLCYLAPEIIRSLKVGYQLDENLPFSKASDVFAFGLVKCVIIILLYS